MAKYNADSIVYRTGADAFRSDISRYLGSSDVIGIRNQFSEMLDNAIDESARYYHENKMNSPLPVIVTITNKDELIIEDFGGGIPCEVSQKYGVPAIYPICESDSAGAKSNNSDAYSSMDTSGVHGAGMAVSIAATEYTILEVNSTSANGKYLLKYENGVRAMELERIGDLDRKTPEEIAKLGVTEEEAPSAYLQGGTKITLKYDETLFKKSLLGRTISEVYDEEEIINRIKYSLIGSSNQFYVIFKYKDKEERVLTSKDFTPEMVLDSNTVVKIPFNGNGIQPFVANLYLSVVEGEYSAPVEETIINRLRMIKTSSDKSLLDSIVQVLLKYRSMAAKQDKKFDNIRIDSRKIKLMLSRLLVMNISSAEFAGQTKQNFVSSSYLIDFEDSLAEALTNSPEFFNFIVKPIFEKGLAEFEGKQKLAKLEAERKKREAKKKENKEMEDKVERLLTDKVYFSENQKDSKITIKDSPFSISDSTLVYVEGESAGSVFNDLHEEGELPVAIAIAKGNMPNVTDDANALDDVSIDNQVYCLKKGYKDIAIFTDADSDGLHIKILHAMQILRFAPEYLNQGKVYLIPAPYSKVRLESPMLLDLYGQKKIYTVGENYTYSAKEHQSLINAGGLTIKKFTGLADSDLSPNYLLKHRENWIAITKINDRDIKALTMVLSEETKQFRAEYTSKAFSYRQYADKYIHNTKREIEIQKSQRNRLVNPDELDDRPDFGGYEKLITDNVEERIINLGLKM